ncbi:MAG: hypothetical protein ABIH18_02965 [Candidatus Omnitrophota bacterium]
MKRIKSITLISLIFLIIALPLFAISHASVDTEEGFFQELVNRYKYDEEFNNFVKVGLVFFIALSVLISIMGFVFMIEQIVLWSFIGGFIGICIVEFLLYRYMGISFGYYSYLVAFVIGGGLAMFVQTMRMIR